MSLLQEDVMEVVGQDKPEASQDKPVKETATVRKSASAFRTISEVSDILGVQQHVLRFWETKFTQVKPLKRGGGRRYYRPEDVELLKRIHNLLYTEGYTIRGVQKLLKGQGKAQIIESPLGVKPMTQVIEQAAEAAEPAPEPKQAEPVKQDTVREVMSSRQKAILESMLGDLKDLRDMIKGE